MSPQPVRRPLGAALFFVVLLSVAGAEPVRAGSYSCAVPRALLCEGCADQIAIFLRTDGRCRVTFTPGQPATSPASGGAPLVFTVELGPAAAPMIRRPPQFGGRRVNFANRHREGADFKPPQPRCFVFNENRYCE